MLVGVPDRSQWPLSGLVLRTAGLELSALTHNDMSALAALLPADVELDPSRPLVPGIDTPSQRTTVQLQTWWDAWGSWQPESWHLHFAARAGGELVGVQELEGQRFPTLRTVDSSSWLVRSARGQGVGTRMRAAVLAFAFGSLGAEEAVTSAWHDNAASLGVSQRLGYEDNGVSTEPRGPERTPDTMVHLRLTRTRWYAHPIAVNISGFEPCRAHFGLHVDQA